MSVPEGQYLCVYVGGSQGPAGGGGAVRVTGAGEGAVTVAVEGRRMAEGRVSKSERLRTLRVALHTVTETDGQVILLIMLFISNHINMG